MTAALNPHEEIEQLKRRVALLERTIDTLLRPALAQPPAAPNTGHPTFGPPYSWRVPPWQPPYAVTCG